MSISTFSNAWIEKLNGFIKSYLDESKFVASYALGSGQSISAGGVIKFDTKLVDTKSSYNTSTGILTIPENGYYKVSATLFSVDATTPWQYRVNHNGAQIARSNTSKVFQVTNQSTSDVGPIVFYANKDDTVDFSFSPATSGNIYANSADNYFSIEKL